MNNISKLKRKERSIGDILLEWIKEQLQDQLWGKSKVEQIASSIVENNIYDSPSGDYKAFGDGYYVFLEPLTPGKHDVNLRVSVLNLIEPSYNYNVDWTYHLNVVPSNSTITET